MELLYGLHPVRCALVHGSRRAWGRLWALEDLVREAESGASSDGREYGTGGGFARNREHGAGTERLSVDVVRLARARGIRIEPCSRQDVQQRMLGVRHQGRSGGPPPPSQGLVLEVSPLVLERKGSREQWDVPLLDRNPLAALEGPRGVVVCLDGLQDPHNVGSILRSALLLGADAVVLGARHGVGPTPAVSKASSGALEVLAAAGGRLFAADRLDLCLQTLREQGGSRIASLAPDSKGDVIDVREWRRDPEDKAVIVLGGEGGGVRPLVRRQCGTQVFVRQDVVDGVDSLNVGVTAGIVLHALQRT